MLNYKSDKFKWRMILAENPGEVLLVAEDMTHHFNRLEFYRLKMLDAPFTSSLNSQAQAA